MPEPARPGEEHSHTYFVQDNASENELTRLKIQDQMFTTSMGGLLSEQPEAMALRRVLDVGCGAGYWLIEMARAYPDIELLVGIDRNEHMVEYARAEAEAQRVSERVAFRVMDALRPLEFPDDYFDLVNQRLGNSYLRTWDWPGLLREYQRVTRPGGIVRVTENDILSENTSPALTALSQLFLTAFYRAGYLFSAESKGITGDLARLLSQSGLQNVQTRAHALTYRAGTPEWRRYYEDVTRAETALPFIRKWGQIPKNYAELRAQSREEMQRPDFVATLSVLTAWGYKA